MGTFTAQNLLDENNYSTDDIILANVERLVNNAIHYIELQTGLSLDDMASQTVTVTDAQEIVIKSLTTLMMRAYVDRGPNTTVESLSVISVLADPQYAIFSKMTLEGINRLRGRSFLRT